MAYVSATYAVGSTGADEVTIDVPSHSDGNVIVCLVEAYSNVTWGFTPAATGTFETTGGAGRAATFHWATRVASSEPPTYTITTADEITAKAVCVSLSGRASATPSASQATNDAGASSTPISTPLGGVTAAEGDDIVILTGAASTTASTTPIAFSAPSGYTTRATQEIIGINFSSGAVAAATRDNVSAGATGTLTGEWSQGSGHADTAGVVLAFAADEEPEPELSAAYVREKLVDKDGDPVASESGITMIVYHEVPTEASPNPYEVIEDVETDSSGDIDVEISLADLEDGDPVWIALVKDGTPPQATMKKVTPDYE